MLTFDIKCRINRLLDILKDNLPDPISQLEQIAIALIYKFMDKRNIVDVRPGCPLRFFMGENEKYAWAEIMKPENLPEKRAFLYQEGIEKISTNLDLPQVFREIFRGAYLFYSDSNSLSNFLSEINYFSDDNKELEKVFEYLLSTVGYQNDASQFCTPRHIIDLIVEIVDPQKNESILDPACGTGGFLISSCRHILAQNQDNFGRSTLTLEECKHLSENFVGYDVSGDMVRLSRINLCLQYFLNPKISEYDTISDDEKWGDFYDVIFANPPFMMPKAGIVPNSRYWVQSKRPEALFVEYIAEHLTPTGRAAIIVPEGIVFNLTNSYKKLRKFLVCNGFLSAVISLPSGIFNPYSSVKTCILIIDKSFAKAKDEILFVKLNNDGFDLGAQRREIKGSEIPEVISIYKEYRADLSSHTKNEKIRQHPLVKLVSKEKIAENGYLLDEDRYEKVKFIPSIWPIVELRDICEVIPGESPGPQFYNNLEEGLPFYEGESEFAHGNLRKPKKWTTRITTKISKNDILLSLRTPIQSVNIVTEDICIGKGLVAIRCNSEILPKYLFYVLKYMELQIKGNNGTAFSSVNRKNIERIRLPLPPIEEQEQIIAKLESHQQVIDGARNILENYQPAIEGESLGSIVKLGDVVELLSGVSMRISTEKEREEISIITSVDITEDGGIKSDRIRKTSSCEAKYQLEKGDLLFYWNSRNSNLLGKTALFNLDGEYTFSSLLVRLRPKLSQIKSEFLWVLLNQYQKEGRFIEFMNSKGLLKLENLEIPCPSLDMQSKIVNDISKEIKIVQENKILIAIFEEKIKNILNDHWGRQHV